MRGRTRALAWFSVAAHIAAAGALAFIVAPLIDLVDVVRVFGMPAEPPLVLRHGCPIIVVALLLSAACWAFLLDRRRWSWWVLTLLSAAAIAVGAVVATAYLPGEHHARTSGEALKHLLVDLPAIDMLAAMWFAPALALFPTMAHQASLALAGWRDAALMFVPFSLYALPLLVLLTDRPSQWAGPRAEA